MIIVRKSQMKALAKKRRQENAAMLLTGLLIGAAIGSLIALLFTPYEGSETRNRISGRAGSLKSKCLDLFNGCCSIPCCCGETCEDDNCCEGSCSCDQPE